MRKPRTRKPVTVPIHGNIAHNAAFHHAIGGLVIGWANSESVFLAMLQALVGGGTQSAAIIWEAQKTSRNRLELVGNLVREQVGGNPNLVDEIHTAIRLFKGLSGTRNFFCHATYNYDPTTLSLRTVTSFTVGDHEQGPVSAVAKPMDRATLNEINDATLKLGELNRRLWALVQKLESALGVRHVRLPEELFGDSQTLAPHHPTDEAQAPGELPSPSEESPQSPIELAPATFRGVRLLSEQSGEKLVGLQYLDQNDQMRALALPLRNAMYLMAMLHAMREQSGFDLPDDLHDLAPDR